MGRVPHIWDDGSDPQDRLHQLMERGYRGRPSDLARELGCSKKAAENLLLGHWPGPKTLAAIVRRFGRDALEALFAPEIEPVLARLSAEERALEERLEMVRARRRQAAGGGESRPECLAALQDGTAVDDRGADRGGR